MLKCSFLERVFGWHLVLARRLGAQGLQAFKSDVEGYLQISGLS